MMRRLLFWVLAIVTLSQLSLAAVQSAFCVIVPRPIGNESRIKVINYVPNTVISFTGHYMYHSIIEFSNDEKVETITMGTASAWQIHPTGNRIFLKPIDEDAETNMTVITTKRMYFFEMHAEHATDVGDKNIVFMMKFLYQDGPQSGVSMQTISGATIAPDLTQPNLYNFRYEVSGKSSEIEPILIFDDGEFTYFKFRHANTELPAFFIVNSDGTEGMVNYRMYGGYIVVERVAKQFTLRHGHDVVCVFNTEYDEVLGQNVAHPINARKDIATNTVNRNFNTQH